MATSQRCSSTSPAAVQLRAQTVLASGPWQLPLALQPRRPQGFVVASWSFGQLSSGALVTALQRPSEPQAWHSPSQAESQQTPSAQARPLAHSLVDEQASPMRFRGVTQASS